MFRMESERRCPFLEESTFTLLKFNVGILIWTGQVFIIHVLYHLKLSTEIITEFQYSIFLFVHRQTWLTCLLIPTPGCGTKTKYKPGLLCPESPYYCLSRGRGLSTFLEQSFQSASSMVTGGQATGVKISLCQINKAQLAVNVFTAIKANI